MLCCDRDIWHGRAVYVQPCYISISYSMYMISVEVVGPYISGLHMNSADVTHDDASMPAEVYISIRGTHHLAVFAQPHYARYDMNTILRFSKLTDNAFPPTKGSDRAAGFDLRSAYRYVVPKHGKQLVMTDLQIHVPKGSYGRIAPRSGLAVKHFIDVGAGVIDEDYRGNVGIVLFNHSDSDFEVDRGDRVAQLICEKIVYAKLVQLESLTDTARGAAGFGSTGTN